MTTLGNLRCTKKIVGECEVSYVTHPGGIVSSQIVIENPSAETCTVAVLDDVAWAAASSAFTFTAIGESQIDGGAVPTGFTAAGADLIDDAAVVLPPCSFVVYLIEATIDEDAFCPSTYTNIAQICTDKEKAPKWLKSETVTILPTTQEQVETFGPLDTPETTKFCVDRGVRDDDQTEIIYHLMPSQEDGGKAALVMDWIENGCRDIGDLIIAVGALLDAAGLDWPKVASPLYGAVKEEDPKG